MTNALVIVESPAKARTIQKYLGKGYVVMASKGHIRDLPKSGLQVDVEHGYTPSYEVLEDHKALVTELRRAAKEPSGTNDRGSPLTVADRPDAAVMKSEPIRLARRKTVRVTGNRRPSAPCSAVATGARAPRSADLQRQRQPLCWHWPATGAPRRRHCSKPRSRSRTASSPASPDSACSAPWCPHPATRAST